MLSHFSPVQVFGNLWTLALQASLSMAFSRQEYSSGFPCLLPGDLPDQVSNQDFSCLLYWQGGSLPLAPPGELVIVWRDYQIDCLGGSDGKSAFLQCRRPGFDPWFGQISWRRKWQPTPICLPGKFLGQRSLACCSPWAHTEPHTTE